MYGLTNMSEPTVNDVALADEAARAAWMDLRRVRNRAVAAAIDPETRLKFGVSLGRFVESNQWEQLVEEGDVVRLGDIGPDALAQAITDRGEWLVITVNSGGSVRLVAENDPVRGYGIVAVPPQSTVLAHTV